MKIGRIILELERIYGVQHGGNHGNQYTSAKVDNVNLATREDIANQLGKSVSALNDYKKLPTLIPEFQDIVDGQISASTASRIVASSNRI